MRERVHDNQLMEIRMGGKLKVTVRPDGDEYSGTIEWSGEHGMGFREIPKDIDQMTRDLNFMMADSEVARIIYATICNVYNETLTKLQDMLSAEDWQQEFPYYREGNYVPITWTDTRDYSYTPTIMGATSYAIADDVQANSINYLTADEYEEKKQRGELHSGCMYLILNKYINGENRCI